MKVLLATAALAAASLLGAPAPGLAQAPAAHPVPPSAQGRMVLPGDVTPDRYDISVTPDARALTFKGAVKIEVTVHRPTRRIELNAADIAFDRVALVGRPGTPALGTPAISLDPAQQTATFTFAEPLAPGRYTLAIDYHGKIYQQASGFFALDYDTPKGKSRALFTQFENSDARRFVPSWDEPGRKARFDLTVTAPADEMAVSNMPVASSEALGGGVKRVRFAETPKMSSYLLFLGIGDFERVSRMVDGVDVGVIVKRGDRAQAAFALDAAAHILPYYDTYFGTKFPLPKLDLIAGPGVSQFFGAMENWGAIFYFERDLLIDPRIATEADRQNVYIVVAHEMAHQWFGDLVTMAWWDDLWLNEGFASWMENKVTDHFHPEWRVWLQQLQAKNGAMQEDAKAGTHPIIQPIGDILQASGAFDAITYDKGASVIRMLEAYTGEDAWRAGVRRYIAAHAYGNAVTDNLWREIDAVSPRKVTDIAHDFTLQAGVPMIAVRQGGCAGDLASGRLGLTQGRFGLDEADKAARSWTTPVIVQGSGEAAKPLVIQGAPATVATNCPSVVNVGQTGYFRTLYDAPAFAGVETRYPELAPEDQLGILNDTSAEAYAGYAPMSAFLSLAERLPPSANPVVWTALAGRLAALDGVYDGLPGQARFRAWALARLQPVLASVGWDDRASDAPNVSTERTAVLAALGRMGDPAVIAEARRRFAALQGGAQLQPAIRASVLSIVAANADAATWDQLHALARTAPSQLEKAEYYSLLGQAADEALARRALDLALTDEPAPTTRPNIIRAVSGRHPALALSFTIAHFDEIAPLLESTFHNAFAPRLALHAADLAVMRELDAFANARIPAGDRGEVVKADAQIRYNAMIRDQRLPEVDRWLEAHGRS